MIKLLNHLPLISAKKYIYATLAMSLFGAGAAVSWGYTKNHYASKIAKIEKAQAEREAEIATTVLEAQQNQITQMETALNAAQKQTIQARADADAATAATRKLRKSLADYRARHANTAASSGQGEPGSDPIGVLADLLSRMGEAGERISRYADEVKIAGRACENIQAQP